MAGSMMNGDYPASEAASPLSHLCSLFEKEELLENIDPEVHDAILWYGGYTVRDKKRKCA
jgi:hypothetical protein